MAPQSSDILLVEDSSDVKPVVFEEFVAVIGEVGRYWLGLNQPPW